jgi:hypothetical protein
MFEPEIDNKLKATILEFMQISDDKKQDFVEKNQDIILNPSTDRFLLHLASTASYSEEAKINTFRKVLLECNYKNVKAAFLEHEKCISQILKTIQEFIATPHLEEKQRILKDNPDLLTSLGTYALNRILTEAQRNAMLTGTSKSARMQKVNQNSMLLMKCTEFGVEFPFWEIRNNHDDYWVSQMELLGIE